MRNFARLYMRSVTVGDDLVGLPSTYGVDHRDCHAPSVVGTHIWLRVLALAGLAPAMQVRLVSGLLASSKWNVKVPLDND